MNKWINIDDLLVMNFRNNGIINLKRSFKMFGFINGKKIEELIEKYESFFDIFSDKHNTFVEKMYSLFEEIKTKIDKIEEVLQRIDPEVKEVVEVKKDKKK